MILKYPSEVWVNALEKEITVSQDKQPDKRRSYFVKKDFQFRFILKFCLLLFIGVIISTVLLPLFSWATLTSSFQQSRLVVNSVRHEFDTILLCK